MSITLGNGSLVSFHAQFDSGVIDALVEYQFSNGNIAPKMHNGIPIIAVANHAAQQGRALWTPDDVCGVIAAAIPDFAPNTITPKA